MIRRHVTITAGFEYHSPDVKSVLLKAISDVPRVLKTPQPYVRITAFQNYAVEYTLYVFINDIKNMRAIDAELHETVLKACKQQNIDLSTPLLLRQIQD